MFRGRERLVRDTARVCAILVRLRGGLYIGDPTTKVYRDQEDHIRSGLKSASPNAIQCIIISQAGILMFFVVVSAFAAICSSPREIFPFITTGHLCCAIVARSEFREPLIYQTT